MEFDPQHGPVERGTAGHRASAEVADVAAEVAALEGFALMTRLQGESGAPHPSCQERHDDHIWLMGGLPLRADKRFHAGHAVRLKLAMLTPYVTMMRATAAHREAQQQRRALYAGFDVGQGDATTMMTYHVDGDTLHIVQAVTLPARAQTVTVNVTIGGE